MSARVSSLPHLQSLMQPALRSSLPTRTLAQVCALALTATFASCAHDAKYLSATFSRGLRDLSNSEFNNEGAAFDVRTGDHALELGEVGIWWHAANEEFEWLHLGIDVGWMERDDIGTVGLFSEQAEYSAFAAQIGARLVPEIGLSGHDVKVRPFVEFGPGYQIGRLDTPLGSEHGGGVTGRIGLGLMVAFDRYVLLGGMHFRGMHGEFGYNEFDMNWTDVVWMAGMQVRL